MNLVSIFVGIVLLLFGRRLFWFFVAATGFTAGMYLAREHFQVDSTPLVLAIALLAGLIGALLSLFMQKLALALAGFVAGGYLAIELLDALRYGTLAWIGAIVGGIVGAVLLVIIFDWALIGFSALLGSVLIAQNFREPEVAFLVFFMCLVVGVVAQGLQFDRLRRIERRPSEARES